MEFFGAGILRRLAGLGSVDKRAADTNKWLAKQALASPSRYYGDGGTFQQSGVLDVEVFEGRVVAVWFRCQRLPYHAAEVDPGRAAEMDNLHSIQDWPKITGVEVRDPGTRDTGGLTI